MQLTEPVFTFRSAPLDARIKSPERVPSSSSCGNKGPVFPRRMCLHLHMKTNYKMPRYHTNERSIYYDYLVADIQTGPDLCIWPVNCCDDTSLLHRNISTSHSSIACNLQPTIGGLVLEPARLLPWMPPSILLLPQNFEHRISACLHDCRSHRWWTRREHAH